MFKKITITMLLALLAAGCSHVERKELDASNRARIKKIALLQVPPSQGVTIRNDSVAVPIIGGILPALIEQNVNGSHSQQYIAKLNEQKITFAPELATALQTELAKNGYQVEYLSDQHAILRPDKTVDYSQIKTDADAILHVYYRVTGYISLKFHGDYSPWVSTAAKLIDPKTQTEMYAATFVVSPDALHLKDSNIYGILPEATPRFDSFDELMAGFDKSTEAITVEARKIAAAIVQQLK